MAGDVSVYVVDDDVSTLTLFEQLLSARGFQPECFSSGEAFLEKCRPDGVGCVVTDLRLPGIQGVEIQARLRAMRSHLAFVVVSGAADVPTAVEMMRNGAVTVLQKPFSPESLFHAVESAITRSRRTHERHLFESQVRRRLESLTVEEREVLSAMLTGKPNKAVSVELSMSSRTLDRRRQAVFEKMNVASVAELALMVSTLDLASDPSSADAAALDPLRPHGSRPLAYS